MNEWFTEEEKALIREGLQRATYEAEQVARRRKYSVHPRMMGQGNTTPADAAHPNSHQIPAATIPIA